MSDYSSITNNDMVVATAVKAGADYLISGDMAHIVPLKAYQGISIVTAAQFLTILSHRRPH